MTIALVIYGFMSLLTFGLYWSDRRRARAGGWRIPESMLHAGEFLGGWPGALLAQRMVRHKTRKQPYVLVVWTIVIVHVAGWAWWLGAIG
jgi:uncharacterized membrane protein YsdA (DUF1294 family)